MDRNWSAVWDLIGRPWFTRRWIVQECVLSDHKHVYVGDRSFFWQYLVYLVLLIDGMDNDVTLRKRTNVCTAHEAPHYLPDAPDRIESLKSLHEAYSISHRPGIHTVHGYRKKSLTTFGQPMHKRGAAYRVRRCCNARCDGCDALILGVRHKCLGCEDFELCDSWLQGAQPASHDAAHSLRRMSPKSAVYYASGGSRITLGPDPDFSSLEGGEHITLETRGWFVDAVSRVGPWVNVSSRGPGRISIGLDLSWLPGSAGPPGPGDTTGLSEGFLRAITGNRRISTVRSATDDWEEQISCVTGSWLQAVRDSCLAEDSQPLSELQKQIIASMSIMASGSRRYDVTGKSIGFVPTSTDSGDTVCILAGCTVPVVLRQTTWLHNDKWVLVGECYVEGLMEGELMKTMMGSGKVVEPDHTFIG